MLLDDYLLPLLTSAVNKKFTSNVKLLMSKGLERTSAIRRSLKK